MISNIEAHTEEIYRAGGRMTMQELSVILKCIIENSNVVGLTIAEYLPFDEH